MMKRLRKAHGHRSVKQLTRGDVLGWRDEIVASGRRGTANNMLRCMKVLMSFAVDRDWRADNPLYRIKEAKGGEHRPWTEAKSMRNSRRAGRSAPCSAAPTRSRSSPDNARADLISHADHRARRAGSSA